MMDGSKIVRHDYGVHQQTRPSREFAPDVHDHSAGMPGSNHVAADHGYDRLRELCPKLVRLDN